MNLLSQRIKEAKRELTALKTAHKRGFGLLKIYKTECLFSNIPGLTDNYIYDATTTVTFSREFAPFPMAFLVGNFADDITGWFALSADAQEIKYSNDGYTVTFVGTSIYASKFDLDRMFIYSTAPVSSISYNWSR